VADVIPAKGEKVEGALYLVSLEDLKALDRYEGYPTLYDRHEITVTTEKGEVATFVYRMLDHYTEALPSDVYFEIIRQGYVDWNILTEGLYKVRRQKN